MEKHTLKTQDGYQNFAARLGMGEQNLLASSTYDLSTRALTNNRTKLDGMYRGSWIIGKAIDVRAEDMTRKGIEIKAQIEPDKVTSIQRELRRLGIHNRLSDAIKWGGLYGGAIAVLLIEGQDMSTPLDLKTISKGDFKGLRVYSRWECVPSIELINDFGPMEGYPKYYTIATGDAANGATIHWSRCIRFIGVELPYWERIATLQWGASLVERWYDRLCAYDSATQGGANLLLKSYLRVLKIKDFREVLATGGEDEMALVKSIGYMRMFESNEGMSIMDAEDEFQTYNWSFSGMSEALLSFAEQIAGAIETPLVRLLGQSPAGLNSTGDADLENYYGGIESKQNDDLRPAWDTILPIVEISLFGSSSEADWEFDFQPLWQLRETEKADIALKDMQLVDTAFTAGLINKATALKELKERSRLTGRFTNITDEDIEKAEEEDAIPTLPEGALNEEENIERALQEPAGNREGLPAEAVRGGEGNTKDSKSWWGRLFSK